MSITSRINEMSSHIEQAYDELQGLGADLTNVNKNIENISMVLDDIYDSMPQVSGEGTSLTLDDTRVGKIKSTLKGNASQTGTPTPSSPIPVNVVSGDNEINVCGKNLLKLKNGSNVSQGVTITINDNKATFVGTPTRAYVGSVDMPLNLKKGTYTLSSTNGVNSFFLWFKNQSGNVFSSVAIRPNPSTITLNEDTYSIQVGLEGLTVGTACNVETYFQLEKGSSATTYEAYQGNTYNIDLPVENLFDKDNVVASTGLTSEGGTFSSNNYCITGYIKVGGNISMNIHNEVNNKTKRVCYYTSQTESSFINVSEIPNNKVLSFTTPSNCQYIRLQVEQSDKDNTMLEYGSKQNSFTPYGTTPIELCKIGNYQDYFYKDNGKWYLHKEINKVAFSNVDYGSLSTYYDVNAISIAKTQLGWQSAWTSGVAIMNKYSEVTNASSIASGTFATNLQQGNILIFNLAFTDIATARSLLEGTVLYIRLATPTNTEITYQPLIDQLNLLEKAMSKDGQTNISQVNNDLPFIISASALKEWQESTSLNSTLSMVNPLSLGNTLNTQDNNIQPIEVDNIEPLEEEENEES